jgi:hypothetical protein
MCALNADSTIRARFGNVRGLDRTNAASARWRVRSLPGERQPVLGTDLKRSESRCCCGTPAGHVRLGSILLKGFWHFRAILISRSRANSKLFKAGHGASSSFAHASHCRQLPLPAWPRGYVCEGSPACSGSATPKTTADARGRLGPHRCGRYSTHRRTRCSPHYPCRSRNRARSVAW